MQKVINIYPPLIGVLVDLKQVPDPVFADKMVGDGIAIDPLEDKIYAPVNGIVKSIAKTKHAITFTDESGFDVLVHIGLETVSLNGVGFELKVHEGDHVTAGNIIGKFDLNYVSQCAKSLITPVILADLDSTIFSFEELSQQITQVNKPILQVTQVALANTNNANKKIHLVKSDSIKIINRDGLHARPSAQLSTLAKTYPGDILIEKNGEKANVKSVISLMKLAIAFNDVIYIHAPDKTIIDELTKLINGFVDHGEKPVSLVQESNSAIKDSKYFGIAASIGIATGKLIKRSEVNFDIVEQSENQIAEKEFLFEAINTVRTDIEYNLSNMNSNDEVYKEILNAHLLLLQDPQIIEDSLSQIEHNGVTAAFAFNKVIVDNCRILASSGNQLLVERQTDLKDLRNRVLNAMSGVTAKPIILSEPTILVADELTPTDLVKIDKNVVGLVSVTGGATSHVAILARVKGIPLLVGVNSQILSVDDNIHVILDTKNGFLDLAPSMTDINAIKQQIAKLFHQREVDIANANERSITNDGHEIRCMANITSVKEASAIKKNGGAGVGLFRTEFLFFDREHAPTVSEQQKIYNEIADTLDGLPFTIRTLDAGGEKKVDYIKLPFEVNPGLGIRGIRLCLEQRELLLDQLTAIFKVEHSNIKVMLPMIASIEEYRQVLDIFNELKQKHGVKHKIELGIMVEVPSAALLSDIFAKEVAFFSIGTNDLTQYTLAIDREHPKLASAIDHLHPAVVRNIELVTRGAKKYDKPVSVCGLMASEKLAIPVLIGLGIRQLSMNINVIAENKAFIRKLNLADCESAAAYVMTLATTAEVREYLTSKYKELI
jgi:phosphoenolpyruvate-protein phosphotransferase